MADTMQFDLVSPERSLMSAQVASVQIPGADGDMTALPDHAPVITTLRPGILSVEADGGTQEFIVTGGFAELGAGVSVLAESALPKADLDQAMFDGMVEDARGVVEQAKTAGDGAADEAEKRLADLLAVGAAVGLNA